jgi:hypothetical protein
MNVEIYSYSLIATLLGMLVVFLSLGVLSVMMVVLKGIFSFARRPAGGTRREGRRQPEEESAGQVQGAGELPRWAMAAVAVYLAGEESESGRPSAEPWNAEVNHYDPWIAGGKFSKRGV